MVWPAIAAAGISAAGSMYSSGQAAQSQAAANEYNVAIEESRLADQRAMQKYGAAAGNELAETKRIYSEAQLSPYTRAGAEATEQQRALLGLAGTTKYNEALSRFKESPGQKYLRDQQEKARLRNAAATGGLRAGRTQIALQEDAFGRAQTDYGNYYNRLSGLRDTGGQSASQLASQYRGQTSTPVPEYGGIARPGERRKKGKLISTNPLDVTRAIAGDSAAESQAKIDPLTREVGGTAGRLFGGGGGGK